MHGLTDNSGIKPKLEPDGPFKYCDCEKEFSAPIQVRAHQQAEHGYFGCDQCSRVLKTSSALNRHMLLCHKIDVPVIGTNEEILKASGLGDDNEQKSDQLKCI